MSKNKSRIKLVEVEKGLQKVTIVPTLGVLAKLDAIHRSGSRDKDEVHSFLTGEYLPEENVLKIDNIILFPQDISAVHVESDFEDYCQEYKDNKDKIIGSWHVHPGIGTSTFASKDDVKTDTGFAKVSHQGIWLMVIYGGGSASPIDRWGDSHKAVWMVHNNILMTIGEESLEDNIPDDDIPQEVIDVLAKHEFDYLNSILVDEITVRQRRVVQKTIDKKLKEVIKKPVKPVSNVNIMKSKTGFQSKLGTTPKHANYLSANNGERKNGRNLIDCSGWGAQNGVPYDATDFDTDTGEFINKKGDVVSDDTSSEEYYGEFSGYRQ